MNGREPELRHRLWNDAPDRVGPRDATTYESAAPEQYRLYVEMADRVSPRRGLMNSFFLTLKTAVFTLVTAFGKTPPGDKARGGRRCRKEMACAALRSQTCGAPLARTVRGRSGAALVYTLQ
jgi:hypothetical protein